MALQAKLRVMRAVGRVCLTGLWKKRAKLGSVVATPRPSFLIEEDGMLLARLKGNVSLLLIVLVLSRGLFIFE